MPRLSLWKPEKHNDYRYLDRIIKEQFTVGATDLYIHKYIGTNNPVNSTDTTQPHYPTTSVTNIQDLLFMENRDRKYDTSIYRLRGHYNVQNLDFDLSQFGLFLTNDIIFITVHYNDMIDVIGRKLMVGDVFELPHLTDYHPLNETIPIGLRRYYQITDANFASEGFSQTWYPHMWRIKCEPMINSQEFSDILNQPINKDNYLGDYDPTKTYPIGYTVTYGGKIYTPKSPGPVPPGVYPPDPNYWQLSDQQSLNDIVGTYNKNLEINNAVIEEAKNIVPKLGYDRHQLYVVPTYTNGEPALPTYVIINNGVPVFATGTVVTMRSQRYAPAAVIQIPRSQVSNFSGVGITRGTRILLQQSYLPPERTDSGSGPVAGTMVISARILEPGTDSPYPTADNSWITGDQFAPYVLTATQTNYVGNEFTVVEIPDTIQAGQLVTASFIGPNGRPISIFAENTRIVAWDLATKTITIDQELLSGIAAGTAITVNSDFTGREDPPIATYQTDNDPRFDFIRRSTPRSFGWIAGYNTGDGTAPNGEPLESGTSFPKNPKEGDYFLRIDYLPQKLYRWSGKSWVQISTNVRTGAYMTEEDKSQLSSFINNTATVPTAQGTTIPSRQSLSKAFRIDPD